MIPLGWGGNPPTFLYTVGTGVHRATLNYTGSGCQVQRIVRKYHLTKYGHQQDGSTAASARSAKEDAKGAARSAKENVKGAARSAKDEAKGAADAVTGTVKNAYR